MKGKRTDLGASECGVSRALQIVGDWWSMLIVRDAFLGHQRFGEFQKNIGLAKNILSARLKKLVDEGILRIEPDSESPSVNRYVLTERGRRLGVVLIALWQWGEENCFAPGELPVEVIDKASGQTLRKLELRGRDGRVFDPDDFQMGLRLKA